MTQLPNPFLNSAMPTAESAVAFSDPSGSDATAAPSESPAKSQSGNNSRNNFPEFSSNEGRPEEAPGALGTEFIHEIFFYARKLMTNYPGFVLDEARFLADIEEIPLFIREDGYLKRQA